MHWYKKKVTHQLIKFSTKNFYFNFQTIATDSAQVAVMSEYISIPFFELLVYSYLGETLTIQNSRIINAIMNSNWHQYMIPVKKELSIIMSRSMVLLYFSTGKLFKLSMNTFFSVSF